MRRAFASRDDRLLAQLQAPPDLNEGMQALTYWSERRQRLAWYRLRARREATRMSARWEERVREAMLRQPGVPVTARVSAGVLLARTRLRRLGRWAAIAATATLAIIAAPFIAALVLLVHALV